MLTTLARTVHDPEARLPADFIRFLDTLDYWFSQIFEPDDQSPQNERIHQVVQALEAVGLQERMNDRIAESERPPRADITALIADFKAAVSPSKITVIYFLSHWMNDYK